MKARLVLSALFAILLAGAVNGFPQGTFFFNNNVSTAITNIITGTRATGLTVAMYFSTDTNSLNPGIQRVILHQTLSSFGPTRKAPTSRRDSIASEPAFFSATATRVEQERRQSLR